VYEKYIPRVPTMHWEVVTNRTALASLIATFFNGITSISIIYFLPIYFQAVFLASPLQSAIYSLPSAILISPFSFLNGIAVLKSKRYLPGNYVGWVLVVIGFAFVSMLGADSSLALSVGQVIVSVGTGIVISSLPFPLMAPIPVEHLGSALAFQAFLRTLSQTWGITISAAILENTVRREFPSQFLLTLPNSNSDLAFAAISRIGALPEPLQHAVKVAFADGIREVYRFMIGVAALGLLCVLFMKEVPMRGNVDKKFTLKEKESDVENQDVDEKQQVDEVEVVRLDKV